MPQLEVWIEGASLPGCDAERATADFARLANIPPEQARVLLASGKARRVKRCDADTAEALVKRLADIGVAASCRFSGGLGRVSMGQNHGAAFPEPPSTITLDLDDDAEGKKKNARRVETERGQWRDEPKIVPALHGLRWFADAARLLYRYPADCSSLLLCAYGPVVFFAYIMALNRDLQGIHILLVLMAPHCSFWGFTLARGIQHLRLGDQAEDETAAMSEVFKRPHRVPLLLFCLLLAPLWYAFPLWQTAMFQHFAPQGVSPTTTLVCFFSCMLVLTLGGSFIPVSLALTPNVGLLGLARICWAGVKNWRAFLVCSLPVPLFVIVVGHLTVWTVKLFPEGIGSWNKKGVRRLRSTAFFMAGICLLSPMPLVAYCAARDIFYEESPPADDA